MITFARWPKTALENRRQGLSAMVSAGLLVLALTTTTASEESAADRMFTRLTKMVGHWEGDLVWSGARTGTGEIASRLLSDREWVVSGGESDHGWRADDDDGLPS